jgi:hypothetical protein
MSDLALRVAPLQPVPERPRADWSDFLQTFALTAEQYARLAAMNDFCRNHEIGILLYAHIYREWCRERHCAVLSGAAERVFQSYWAEHGEHLIADISAPFFGNTAGLDMLAGRAVEAAEHLRSVNDEQWNGANDAAFAARSDFRDHFFALTGLKPARLAQLQMEGLL